MIFLSNDSHGALAWLYVQCVCVCVCVWCLCVCVSVCVCVPGVCVCLVCVFLCAWCVSVCVCGFSLWVITQYLSILLSVTMSLPVCCATPVSVVDQIVHMV